MPLTHSWVHRYPSTAIGEVLHSGARFVPILHPAPMSGPTAVLAATTSLALAIQALDDALGEPSVAGEWSVVETPR